MVANLFIEGQIGSYDGEDGVELMDLVAQLENAKSRTRETITSVLVHVKSPGGLVETGEQMASWMEDLKKEYQVDTITNGNVASIATIPYLAGQRRIIRVMDKLMIHNPWARPEGDAKALKEYAAELEKKEKEIASIYADKTGVSIDAIRSFMSNETIIDYEKAIELNFATEKEVENVEVFAYLKSNKKKEDQIPTKIMKKLEKVVDYFMKIIDKDEKKVMLDMTTSEGVKLFADVEDMESLMGATLMIVPEEGDPTPTPAAEYLLDSGETLVTDENGVITEVKAKEEEEMSEVQKLTKRIEELTSENATALAKEKEATEKLESLKTGEFAENVLALSKGLKEVEDEKKELALFKTEFKIPKNKTFAKFTEDKVNKTLESMKDRRKEYKTKSASAVN